MSQDFSKLIQEVRENTSKVEEVGFHTEISAEASLEHTTLLKSIKDDIYEVIFEVFSSIQDLVESIKGNTLKRVEESRELKDLFEQLVANTKKKDDEPKVTKKDKGILADLFGTAAVAAGVGVAIASLASIPVLINGFVSSLAETLNFDKSLRRFQRRMKVRIKALTRSVNGIFQGFNNIGIKIKDQVVKVGDAIKGFFTKIADKFKFKDGGKTGIGRAIDFVKGQFNGIVKSVRGVGDAFKEVKGMFKGVKGSLNLKGIGKIGNAILKFKNFFSPFRVFMLSLKAAAPKFVALGKSIGRVAGKLFLPLTVVMTAWDAITGFIDGFKESDGETFLGKLIDGLYSGIAKVTSNLVGIPLDLLKGGVAWIMEKMGFENASEALKSFSFAELIDKMITGIGDFVQKSVDFVVSLFTNPSEAFSKISSAVGNVKDMILNFHKSILRFILPKPDKDDKWYSPSNIMRNAIPDSVYRYAGLNPDTGELMPEKVATPKKVPITRGVLMEEYITDTANKKAAQKAAAAGPVVIQGGTNIESKSSHVTVAPSQHNDRTTASVMLGFGMY